jgi:hypothetical protein
MCKTRLNCLTALCVLIVQVAAQAKGAAQAPAPQEGWDVAVYPIFAWVPLEIGIEVDIPPFDGDGGGIGDIVDSRFDGAFFGGLAASNGTWRIEADGIWAGIGGDRAERPHLVADVDLIYGHTKVGRRVAPDLYLTAGVRRLALKYDITLGDLPQFSRKPGVWNPLVGIGWHRRGPKVEWHASFEGGGFGVGADVDLAGTVRMDWKPVRHFGITGGYNVLYLKVTDTALRRTVIVQQSVHGPIVGIGFYF